MALQIESIFGESEDSLKDRWQQSNSKVVNATLSSGSGDVTVHTVTTGKKLYITSMQVFNSESTANSVVFTDGDGGDIVISCRLLAGLNEPLLLTFSTPLIFESVIYAVRADASSCNLQGWEE